MEQIKLKSDRDDRIYRAYAENYAMEVYCHDKTDALEEAFDMALSTANGDASMVEFLAGGRPKDRGYLIEARRETRTMLGETEMETVQFGVEEIPIK